MCEVLQDINPLLGNITINPVKPTICKYGINDINSFNDACYQICSEFYDDQQQVIKSECGIKCQNALQDLIVLNERNPCVFNPQVPVLYDKPKFFKGCLIESNGDVNKATSCCINKCETSGVNNVQECKEKCILTANAVNNDIIEGYDPYRYNIFSTRARNGRRFVDIIRYPRPYNQYRVNISSTSPQSSPSVTSNNLWVIILIVVLIIIILLVLLRR